MKAQLSSLISDMPMAVIVIDKPDHLVSWMNLAAQELLSTSEKSALGQPISELLRDNGGLDAAFEKVALLEQNISLTRHDIAVPKGQDQSFNVSVFASHDKIGVALSPLSPQNSYRDESDIESASGLGRMLAHEIKNPLAGIYGAAQLLRDEVKSEEGAELINLISTEMNRIRRLADRMERLGDNVQMDFKPVNIHEILHQARLLFQSSQREIVEFEEHYDPSLPDAFGDADSLMQVMVNIIKNSIEAIEKTEKKGVIRLETSYRSGLHRRVIGRDNEINLPIEVRIIDDGPGVSDEVRNHVFHAFVSDKPAGQGLGLALVSKIIAGHKGYVDMQSRPGQTIFTLRLPRRSPIFAGDMT